MPPESKILKTAIITILIVHTLWLSNHLRWVATEQVNPWKLGGYGMYTLPPPAVKLNLIDIRYPDAHFTLDPSTYSLTRYRMMTKLTNINRAFRCAHIKPTHLKAFFEENPHLRGIDLRFVYMEGKFIQNPVSVERVEQGHVTINWTGNDLLEFTSEFCGNRETGKVSLL
jgi:hypothetical protein